ncbi:MAG: hypothetical protein ACNYNX_00030 [Leucobacter sp.]
MSEDPASGDGVAGSGALGGARKSPVLRAPEAVERWELSGGEWAVVAVGERSATVELRRCDAGEVADRLQLREPEELRWAAAQLAIRGEAE